mgnify:CR=1 FL=1
MITKTITYKDFLGNERTEKFSFHFSEAELGEMELTTEGGMGAYIKKITDEKDAKKLAELFKDVIQKSYGKLSEDGRRFKKSPEILEDFVETNAYSKLWLELATNLLEGSFLLIWKLRFPPMYLRIYDRDYCRACRLLL